MPRMLRKTVFIFGDVFEAIRTSKRVQLTLFLVVVALAIGSYAYFRYAARVQGEQAREEELIATSKRNFDFASVGSSAHSVILGIEVGNDSNSVVGIAKTAMRSALGATLPAVPISSNVLLPAFYKEGRFQEIFQGNISLLQDVNFFAHAETLLLIQSQISFKDSTIGDGMKSCTADVMFRLYSASAPVRETAILLTGFGSTPESSLRNAVEKLPDNKEKLEALLK